MTTYMLISSAGKQFEDNVQLKFSGDTENDNKNIEVMIQIQNKSPDLKTVKNRDFSNMSQCIEMIEVLYP